MKRLLPILLVMLAIAQQALAITNVSGILTGVNTFTKAQSPYVVTANLVVADGAALIVEPGTEIRVDSGVGIFVDGSIRAIGTSADPIVFKSNLTNFEHDSWKGITIDDMGTTDTAIFEHCQFTSGKETIRCVGVNLSIKNCKFTQCGDAIYSLHSARTSIDSNIIKHCWSGIFLMGITGTVSANELAHIGAQAIRVSGTVGVNGNYVHDCYYGIQLSGNGNPNSSEVAYNKVVNVQAAAYYIEGDVAGGVHHNLSAYNGAGYSLLLSGNVEHNTSVHDGEAIYVVTSVSLPNFVFKNNCIDSCTGNYVSLIGDVDVDISGNYWGTTDTAVLQMNMLDYYDIPTRPRGFILPVLGQPNGGCQSYTGPLVTSVTTAKAKAIAITVSPNPFADNFVIDLHGQAIGLSVFNMAGQRIVSLDAKGKNKLEVDMSAYPAGVYHYRVALTDQTIATGKLLKQ